MDLGSVVAIALVVAFATTNGLHDASNAVAALVATRSATPAQAIALATVFNVLGPLVLGTAVADTVGGIVTVAPAEAAGAIGCGLAAAIAWNLVTWRAGLPSSSGHALLGGLVGSALAAGGFGAVGWGEVAATLTGLAVSPLAGLAAAAAGVAALRRAGRRATRRWAVPVRAGAWATSAALAFSHGANDAQKAIGVVAALLVAEGHAETLDAPLWAKVACASALTAGTALGGWRIIRTVGRGIYRISPAEGTVSQASSAAVILGSSLAGAPVSTTQVVASSIVGVGAGRRRWHHVHWSVVRDMGVAWLITIPATAALAAAALGALEVVS